MNKRFCSAVKRALVVGVRPGSEKEDAQSGEELVKSKPSLAKLEQYAESSWNGVRMYTGSSPFSLKGMHIPSCSSVKR